MNHLLLLWIAVGSPSAALADPAPCPQIEPQGQDQARKAFSLGQTLYSAGNYSDAVVAFASALQSGGHPDLLFNLANAYERMGDHQRAAAYLEQYVSCAQPSDRELIAERARRLRRSQLPVESHSVCPISEPDSADSSAAEPGELSGHERSDMPRDISAPPRHPGIAWMFAGAGMVAGAAALEVAARSTSTESCEPTIVRGERCARGGRPPWASAAHGGAVSLAVLGGGALVVAGILEWRAQSRSKRANAWTLSPDVGADTASLWLGRSM